ncbi:hypothetical protein C8R44DRAFT_886199 [Mycena epipterygia]|nr:hypothetical protein C8R44DRAFT_886199 [Mycena epipterygia]
MNSLKLGLVNLPGATPASTALVAERLHEDFEAHHCFFNDRLFHNYLAHQLCTIQKPQCSTHCAKWTFNLDDDAASEKDFSNKLLQVYARTVALNIILRGRPTIDPVLAMSYSALPVPPAAKLPQPSESWAAGPHVAKAIRTLYYCVKRYGNTPAGAVPGAVDSVGSEIFKGAVKLDGMLFILVVGVLTDGLGWVAHGDTERIWDLLSATG